MYKFGFFFISDTFKTLFFDTQNTVSQMSILLVLDNHPFGSHMGFMNKWKVKSTNIFYIL